MAWSTFERTKQGGSNSFSWEIRFHYTSNSGKTKYSTQCEIDGNGQLSRMSYRYYPGQWRDSADTFVEKANQIFIFR